MHWEVSELYVLVRILQVCLFDFDWLVRECLFKLHQQLHVISLSWPMSKYTGHLLLLFLTYNGTWTVTTYSVHLLGSSGLTVSRT